MNVSAENNKQNNTVIFRNFLQKRKHHKSDKSLQKSRSETRFDGKHEEDICENGCVAVACLTTIVGLCLSVGISILVFPQQTHLCSQACLWCSGYTCRRHRLLILAWQWGGRLEYWLYWSHVRRTPWCWSNIFCEERLSNSALKAALMSPLLQCVMWGFSQVVCLSKWLETTAWSPVTAVTYTIQIFVCEFGSGSILQSYFMLLRVTIELKWDPHSWCRNVEQTVWNLFKTATHFFGPNCHYLQSLWSYQK